MTQGLRAHTAITEDLTQFSASMLDGHVHTTTGTLTHMQLILKRQKEHTFLSIHLKVLSFRVLVFYFGIESRCRSPFY